MVEKRDMRGVVGVRTCRLLTRKGAGRQSEGQGSDEEEEGEKHDITSFHGGASGDEVAVDACEESWRDLFKSL